LPLKASHETAAEEVVAAAVAEGSLQLQSRECWEAAGPSLSPVVRPAAAHPHQSQPHYEQEQSGKREIIVLKSKRNVKK